MVALLTILGTIFLIVSAIVGINNTPFSYENMFDSYTFADGTPFGVKVEEDYNGIK